MSIATYGFGFYRPLDNVTFRSTVTDSPPYWHVDCICRKEYSPDNLVRRPGPYSLTGKAVDIYLFSTGVNINHPELLSRAFLLPNYTSTLAEDTVLSGVDCAQTGTGLAVLCAGYKSGICRRSTIYSAKITNELLEFELEDFKLACAAAIANKQERGKASVALISYYRAPTSENHEVPFSDDEFEQAVTSLHEAGFLVVVPSGDGFKANPTADQSEGFLNSRVVSPARMDTVFTVGPVEHTLNIVSKSCYGEPIDAYAPGFGVIVANFDDAYYEAKNGSIYAAALAAGCVGLFLEKNPKATLQDYKKFSRKHFPQYQPGNFPLAVMDEDAVLGADSSFEYGLTFVDPAGMPVSYIPEPVSITTVPLLKSFFTKGVLTVSTEEGNIGSAFYPGNFRFQISASSINFYGETRPLEFYLVEAPPGVTITKQTGTLWGEVSSSMEGTLVLKVAVSDGVYCEQRTFTINVLPGTTQLSPITGRVLIKKDEWVYLRSLENTNVLDSQPLEQKGVRYADSREVVMLDRDSGVMLDTEISEKRTGVFKFGMLPGNYQILVKHSENERYQIKDLRVG